MVLKRLKLHHFIDGVARIFPTHKHGCGVGRGAGCWKSQQKRLFS